MPRPLARATAPAVWPHPINRLDGDNEGETTPRLRPFVEILNEGVRCIWPAGAQPCAPAV